MTIVKIDEKKLKFIKEYEQLCRKYEMMIGYADECDYYLDNNKLSYDEYHLQYQIDSLIHNCL